MRQAEATSELDTTLDSAWARLVDFDGWAAWNPFVVRAELLDGGLRPGDRLRLSVRWVGGGSTTALVRLLELRAPEGKTGARSTELRYEYVGIWARLGAVRSVRTQTLRELPNGRVRYHTVERFGGWLSPLVPLGPVQAGFDAMAGALARSFERA